MRVAVPGSAVVPVGPKNGSRLDQQVHRAFSVGIFLLLVGDVMIWATVWGYLPWPWSGLGWFVWIPAAAAFALAPLYQWEAMRSAESS